MDMFNSFIRDIRLRDLYINGVKFSWSNRQEDPILVNLDRILVSTNWDCHYATSYAWFKARVGSDQSLLVLDTGEQRESRSKYFYFQARWFQHDNFGDMIKGKWEEFKAQQLNQKYSLNLWHGCLQA